MVHLKEYNQFSDSWIYDMGDIFSDFADEFYLATKGVGFDTPQKGTYQGYIYFSNSNNAAPSNKVPDNALCVRIWLKDLEDHRRAIIYLDNNIIPRINKMGYRCKYVSIRKGPIPSIVLSIDPN